MTAADDRVTLGPELARLVDERDVLATLQRYARCIDDGDAVGWADCFTADGEFEIRLRRGTGFEPQDRYVGTERLRLFAATHTHAPDAWHKHVLMGSLVELDGDEATVVSGFSRIDAGDNPDVREVRGPATGPYIRAFGRYSDRLVRCDDGRWRIRRRLAEIESAEPTVRPHRVTSETNR